MEDEVEGDADSKVPARASDTPEQLRLSQMDSVGLTSGLDVGEAVTIEPSARTIVAAARLSTPRPCSLVRCP